MATQSRFDHARRVEALAAALAAKRSEFDVTVSPVYSSHSSIARPALVQYHSRRVIEVYGDIYSGNCFKVKLLLRLLGMEHRWVHVDIVKGESRTDSFLEKNPNGKIPVLVNDDGRVLFESNAILNHLAAGSQFLPNDRFERAEVLQWQFFEQYSHEPFIATSRYIVRYLDSPADRAAELESKRAGGYAALTVMEKHLAHRDYFVGSAYSIADIALYAYTHVAEEGGFSLTSYPNVRGWLSRIASHPRHVTMAELAP